MTKQAENSDNSGKAFNLSAVGQGYFDSLKAYLCQELDIEPALRDFCEWLLPRVGPCNLAVFLPGTAGDYSLGAYVNYDLGKEGCEVLFDTMAQHVDRHFLNYCDEKAMFADLPFLEGCLVMHAVAFGGNEALASVVAFVDYKEGFCPLARHYMEGAAEILGQQLQKIVNVHNRHRPKTGLVEGLGSIINPDDDDDGLELA